MPHRLHKLTAAVGLALLAQAGSAAPILTPVQSVNFCLGVCDVAIDAAVAFKTSGDGVIFKSVFTSFGEPVNLTKTDSTTRNFNTFDTSLGILTKVSFILTSTIKIGLEGGADGGVDREIVTTMTVDPSISLISLGSLLNDPALVPYSLSGTNEFKPKVGSENRNAAVSKTPPEDLSFFTTGSSFVAQFQQDLNLTTLQDCVTTTGNARWEGKLELQYEYEKRPTTSVPEPGTLLLVGTGVMGAVAGLRLKRAAQTA